MKYAACLRVGLNDIKALTNLEHPRRDLFTPLLDMRGNDDRHLQSFLKDWTDHPFFMDISRGKKDIQESFIATHDLHNPLNAFHAKLPSLSTSPPPTALALPPVTMWHGSRQSTRACPARTLSTEIMLRPTLRRRWNM